MLRSEPTADASLADIRARSKFGMAIAAMIRMIATTISSSISEKPFCLRIWICSPLLETRGPFIGCMLFTLHALGHVRMAMNVGVTGGKPLVFSGGIKKGEEIRARLWPRPHWSWADTFCHVAGNWHNTLSSGKGRLKTTKNERSSELSFAAPDSQPKSQAYCRAVVAAVQGLASAPVEERTTASSKEQK